ncbi:MAG: hypothetical protein ACIARQ_13415 [Phycisphaerales bacterium JB061]
MARSPGNQSTQDRWMPVLLGAGVVVSLVWAAGVGEAGGTASIVTAVYLVLTASVFPLLYLLGAIGLGVPMQLFLAPGIKRVWAVRTGLGLAGLLTLTHLLGMTGLLFARPIAIALPILGAALLAHRLTKHKQELKGLTPSLPWLGAVPAIGVLLAAACSPPGWLWASEIGGYDVLSYHLQLPRDWINAGTIWPVEHNVYSYLPGYLEAAFTHTAVALGASKDTNAVLDGDIVFACQLLHALVTLVAGVLSASACSALCERAGFETKLSAIGGAIAGAIVIATPWSVVTGSMAYNEMGVVAFFAAALVIAFEHRLKPSRRGLVAGLLVGAACGCKPTALLFVAPAVGLTLVWVAPRRFWLTLTWTACVGGLVMLLPWLIRNSMAGGNPVFPQLSGVFGSAHWTQAQIERYASAHSFGGSIFDALRLLILPDPTDPAASANSPVHRGLMHPQWSLLLPMSAVALGWLGFNKNTRWLALPMLVVFLLQLLAWLTLTHVQSRFLIPMILPMACVIAAGIVQFGERISAKSAAPAGLVAALIPAVSTVLVFTGEAPNAGGPNAATTLGVSQFMLPPEQYDSAQDLYVVQFINAELPPDAKVLLIGSATPLYITRDLVYTTTWDTSPLTALMREHPDEPARWTSGLTNMGVTHVFVDLGELSRLTGSGWGDPLLEPNRVSEWLVSSAVPIYRSSTAPHLVFELP